MSVYFRSGDLFRSSAQTLAHGCNCKGKMGAGIAQEFKRQFPEMYRTYRQRCFRGQIKPGGHYLYKGAERWVLNFATQADLSAAHIDFVEQCLRDFCGYYRGEGITSLALPLIGSGLGGLEPNEVRQLICDVLGTLPIPIYVYDDANSRIV